MSLSRHLTSSAGEHGRMGFHPDCPRCRGERLAGDLGDDVLVSRRTQAALAAGVLAFSIAAPPSAAVAAEPDQQQEGGSDPGTEPPEVAPDFDPGGDHTFDGDTGSVPDAPEAGGEDDDGDGPPVEEEPPAGVVPHIEPEPEPETVTPQPAPAPDPLPPTPVPPAAAAPVSPPAAPPEAPEPPTGVAKPKPNKQAARPLGRADKPDRSIAAPVPVPAPAPVTGPVSPVPPPSLPAAPAVVESVPVSQAADPPPASVDGERYTVRPGDSLWSIARRQLGPHASTGRVARQVNRLWELNSDRIGTGDPNLLHVGTVLRLP